MPKSSKLSNNVVGQPIKLEGDKKKKAKKVSAKGSSSGVSASGSSGKKKNYRKPHSLDPLREQLRVLTDEANARVKELTTAGVYSKALDEAQRSQAPSHRDDKLLFSADQSRSRDIKRELARTQAFLTDFTSTVYGAQNFVGGLTHEAGLFGGQWRKQGMDGYNEDVVSKEDADLTFSVYHRAIEMAGGWERVIGYFRANNTGLIDYGSEQLINMVYDMVLNMPNADEETLITQVYDYINNMVDLYEDLAKTQRAGVDYGELVNDPDREARIARWRWQVERERYRNGEF